MEKVIKGEYKMTNNPNILITVGCAIASSPAASMIKAAHEHKQAGWKLQELDTQIYELCVGEETLYRAIEAVLEEYPTIDTTQKVIGLEDKEETYLSGIPSNELSIDEANKYREELHKLRMQIYPIKEEIKLKRKNVFHIMKRLSFKNIIDNSLDYNKAYAYYQTLKRKE